MKQSNGQAIIEKQCIEVLSIPSNMLQILKKHRINTLKNLGNKTKRDLINLGLSPAETKKIEIELQLQGLNLRNNL